MENIVVLGLSRARVIKRASVAACLWVFALTSALSQQPPAFALKPVGPWIPFWRHVDGSGRGDFLIERSTNLLLWEPYLHVYHQVPSFDVLDRDTFEQVAPIRLYGVFRQALTPSEMKTNWARLDMKRYRFTFKRTCFDCGSIAGTVTVQDERVVSVENAFDPLDPGRGIENP